MLEPHFIQWCQLRLLHAALCRLNLYSNVNWEWSNILHVLFINFHCYFFFSLLSFIRSSAFEQNSSAFLRCHSKQTVKNVGRRRSDNSFDKDIIWYSVKASRRHQNHFNENIYILNTLSCPSLFMFFFFVLFHLFLFISLFFAVKIRHRRQRIVENNFLMNFFHHRINSWHLWLTNFVVIVVILERFDFKWLTVTSRLCPKIVYCFFA